MLYLKYIYINTEFYFSKVELQNIKEWNFKQEARKKNLTLPTDSSKCTDIAIIYICVCVCV
jgi:hypothetical protein